MDDGTSANLRSHGKNLPGGQSSQLSEIDALTNVPVGQGRYLTPAFVSTAFANPDCFSDRLKKKSTENKVSKDESKYSSSLFPTPLNWILTE